MTRESELEKFCAELSELSKKYNVTIVNHGMKGLELATGNAAYGVHCSYSATSSFQYELVIAQIYWEAK